MIKDSKTIEKNGYAIHHDLEIAAPIDEIFQAITQPEHLINWWPLKCTGTPKLDTEYNFYFTPQYDWFGKVLTLEQNSSFHIKMTKADSDWSPTIFGFDLKQQDDTVLVKFSHVGWPVCNAHFRKSSFCWAMLLNGLKNYLEKGSVVPFEKRE